MYNIKRNSIVDYLARTGNSLSVENIEFRGFKRRSYLVFNDLASYAVSVNLVSVLKRVRLANVYSYRGLEFERASARGSFGVAVHNANLLTKLIYKYNYTVAL